LKEKEFFSMGVYQKKKKWTIKDFFFWGIRLLTIAAVGINASVIIGLSMENTMKFAEILGLPPRGAMFLVEAAFALLLALRAIQRSLRLNTPMLLHIGYFGVFCLLTIVNVHGLYLKNPTYGPWGGLAISALMWLFENILVWLFTKSNQPYEKSILRKYLDTIKQAWEQKMLQKIAWVKFNSQRPDLGLVKQVRRAEKRREKVIGDEELPEFFEWFNKQGNVEEIVVELERTKPKTVQVESTDIVPAPNRSIGFHAEDERRKNDVQIDVQSVQNDVQKKSKAELAYEYALTLYNETEEVPKCRDIVRYSKQFGDKKLSVSLGTAKAGLDQLKKEIEQNQN
jgi:hypothetical protein